MVEIRYLQPGRSPPAVSAGEPWLDLYAKTTDAFFGKGAAGVPGGSAVWFEVSWEGALPLEECLRAAQDWAERHGVKTIWIQPAPTEQRVYTSPDGAIQLIDESVPDDTLSFANSDWHTHGYLLAEQAGLGESPEAARERVLLAVLADKVDIVIEARDGQPYIWINERGDASAELESGTFIVRRWTR